MERKSNPLGKGINVKWSLALLTVILIIAAMGLWITPIEKGITGAAIGSEEVLTSLGTIEVQTEEIPLMSITQEANSSLCGTINGNLTLIDNVNSSDTCFTINASNVILDCNGYTIRYATGGSGYGVNVSANSSTIRNCTLIENNQSGYSKPGILIGEVRDVLIENNNFYTIHTSSNAVYAPSLTQGNITLNNNYMNTSGSSIYLSCSNSLINQNNITSNCYQCSGGVLIGGTNNTLSNNIINMTNNYGEAIYLSYADNGIINNNSIYTIGIESPGIYLSSSANVTLTNNHINVVKSVGVRFKDSDSSILDYLHNIDQTNTVNGLPVLYNYSLLSGIIENVDYSPYGQVICSNCSGLVYNNISVTNRDLSIYKSDNLTIANSSFITDIGLHLLIINSASNMILNNNFDQNGSDSSYAHAGIRFSYSPNATFSNNSVSVDKRSTLLYVGPSSGDFLMDNNRISHYGQSSNLVSISSPFNATNNVLYSNGTSNVGFYITGDSGELINNNISLTSCSGGIISYTPSLQILNNSLRCNSGTTLYAYGNNAHFQDNFISGEGVIGIYNPNQEFVDCTLSNQTDVYISSGGSATLENVTLNTSKITINSGNLTVSWNLDVNITNSTGPLQNANVTVYNVSNNLINSSLTGATGFIETLTLTEFWQNATARYYQTPHTINTSLTNYTTNSTIVNLTQTGSTQIDIVLVPLSGDAYPSWSSNISSTPTTYSPSTYSSFNITWADNNNISIVYLESNYSGSATNYTMNLIAGNISNGTYNYSALLPAGTSYWKSYANDSINQWNSTSQYNFTIAQNAESCGIGFNLSSPVNYPYSFIAYTNCTSDYTLYRNGTTITNGSVQSLAAGSYNFTVVRTDQSNYSNYRDEEIFVVSPASSGVNLTINRSNANITTYNGTTIDVNCNKITGEGDIYLYRNGTLINSGTTAIENSTVLNLGRYNFTCQYNSTQNYSSSSEIYWVDITLYDNVPEVIQTAPAASYVNDSSNRINVTFICNATDERNLQNLSLYLTNSSNQNFQLNRTTNLGGTSNGTNWTIGLNFDLADSLANYTWNCLAYDNSSQQGWGTNKTILMNYTLNSLTFNLNISGNNSFQLTGRGIHTLTLNNATNTSAEVTFQSTPINYSLTVNASQLIDTNSDSYYDHNLTLNQAHENNNATFTVSIASIYYTSSSSSSSSSSSGGGSSSSSSGGGAPESVTPVITTAPTVTTIKPISTPSKNEPTLPTETASSSSEENLPLAGKAVLSNLKEVVIDYGTYWITLITAILFISMLVGGTKYYRRASRRRHLIVKTPPKPQPLDLRPRNVKEQFLKQELHQVDERINQPIYVLKQKPTPASAWDNKLSEIDAQLATLEQEPLPMGRVITDIPPTRGYSKEPQDVLPEQERKKTRRLSLLLAQSIKAPHLLLTKTFHHSTKEKSEAEKRKEAEQQRLLQLHWKIDHYNELSDLEKLQLEYELDQIEKEITRRN